MLNFNAGTKFQNNTPLPFSNFDFSKFEKINSLESAKAKFSEDFFGEEAQNLEIVFSSPFDFSEFSDFFVKEVAPNLPKGSFIKLSLLNFDKEFDFAKFNELSNQFSKQIFFEFSFFRTPTDNFSDFSEFFPPNFNGGFMFFVNSQTTSR